MKQTAHPRTTPSPSALRPGARCMLDLASLVLIAVLSLKFTSQIRTFVDIRGADESGYLYWGILGTLAPSQGPLYGAWYWLLSHFSSDNVALYYLNYRLTALLPWLSLYIFLRSCEVSSIKAFICSWLFSMGEFNITLWPRVTLFFTALALLSVAGVTLLKDRTLQVVYLAVASLILSYIRPETFPLVPILLGYSIYSALTLKTKPSSSLLVWSSISTTVALVILLAFNTALPIDDGTNRAWVAFAQHYSLRLAQSGASDLNPWSDYNLIMKRDFGESGSLVASLLYNPRAIINFAYLNLLGIIDSVQATWAIVTKVSNLQSGLISQHTISKVASSIIIIALIVIPWGAFNRTKGRRTNALQLAAVSLLSIPSLAGAILIFPRVHYLIFPAIAISISPLILWCAKTCTGPLTAKRLLLNAAAWLIAASLTPAATDRLITGNSQASARLDVINTIDSVNRLEFNGTATLLDPDMAILPYAQNSISTILPQAKSAGFLEFITNRDIAIIVLTEELKQNRLYRSDPEWNEFIANPKNFGFSEISIPGANDRKILLRTND